MVKPHRLSEVTGHVSSLSSSDIELLIKADSRHTTEAQEGMEVKSPGLLGLQLSSKIGIIVLAGLTQWVEH